MSELRKTLLTVALASVFLLGALQAQAAPSSRTIDTRIWEQQQRLDQGARTGTLSPSEYYRLEENLWRIIAKKAELEADGRLTDRQMVKLNRALDRNSRAISRLKNNRYRVS
jgi:hypothetical protein